MSSSTYIGRSPRANDFWKLYLLLCKNTSVLLAHPLSTAIILLGPILLFLYTQIDQLTNPKKAIDLTETRYPHIEIAKPNITSIMYSPANNVLRHVMEDVATSLGANLTEAFLYASELQAALKAQDGFVGIEFDDKLRNIMEMPLKVRVALRFPLHMRSRMTWMWSSRLYKRITDSDICIYDSEGFLIVQSKLSEALIRSRNESAYIPQILMQPFPDGQRTDYSYLRRLFLHFITHFTFIFMGPSLIIGQQIVAEKQRHLREVMRIMGLTIGLNWLSWFIVSYFIIFIPMLIIVCLMKVFLCPTTPFGVLLFIFLIYLLTLICFTFMVSTFVTSTTMALTTITLLHMVSFLPYLIITSDMTPTKAVIVALFMNSAMASIWNQVCGFELRGVGAQWHKLFHYCHPDDKLSIGSMLLIMVGTNLIRLLVCFYADQLNLGEFGVAKRWYFPCKRKFWCPWERPRVDMPRRTHYDSIDEEEGPIVDHLRTTLISETATHNKAVMMEAQHLNKTYGENEAVSDFNLKFFEDEVTVMIGPNGSGKTTLFMMLAGLLRPSSGRIIINGQDLALIPQQARKSLSVCTQHDVLFEELSAYWHILFFSRLKGYRRNEAEMEAQRYLEIMNLLDMSTISVSKLPLGMRRKLCICCALCANTKVVLCDEPTACLDPSARREVWSLLQREKSGRCIVMNTHIPEAAAVIGDRLAVLFDGQLYSYGSPEFIVNNLGPGYRLVCVALENCNVDEVTQFLLHRIQTVDLEKIEGLEITYRLPVADVLKFTSLFLALENKLEALHLTSFEVSAPTLSETFIKIGVEKTKRDRKSNYVELFNAWATEPIDKKEYNKWKRYKNDWHGLMIRKILFTRNHLFQFTLIVILPLFGILLSLLIDLIAKKSEMLVINPYDLTVYPGALVIHEFLTGKYIIGGTQIFTDNSQNVSVAYENMAMDAGATVRMSPDQLSLEDYLLKNINLYEEGFQETYVAGVTFRDGSVTAWYNRRLEHGAPLSLGLVYKAVAFVLVKMDIEIINKPRGDSDPSVFEHDNLLSSIKQAIFVMLYLCFAISAFILMPVQERVAQIKRQQLISGVNISTYWLTHLLWDFIIFLLITAVLLLALYKQPIRVIYMFAMIMFVFGLSALTFTYLVSFLFKEPGAAMLYVLVINCFVVLLAISMSGKHKDEVCKHFHYIFLMLPFYAMYSATFEVFKLSKRSHECDSTNVENFEKCRRSLPVCVDHEVIYMAVSAIIYFLLLLLSSKWRRFRYAIKRQTRNCVVHNEDPYVRVARQQIDKLVQNEEQLKECSLVCDRATKKLPHFLAANCVSIKISSNECFAIIGLNNAGKTSLVNMIVGSQMISQGNIYVKGLNVKTQLNKYYQHISYCPQRGHLVKYMTGRQMLRVVGLTSGIKKEFIPAIIAYVGQSFSLDKHLDLKVKYYSSGTKRKLNVAMSMLGRTLICLDEPTTGVDIGAKEEIWIALRQMLDLGRSILITSHNMQECQMLSTCLAIMVNGNLCCYGNVEDVLNRYNKGISIKIQVATSEELQEINALNDSESERHSSINTTSFRESDLTHHTRSLESDVAQSPEQNSLRVSEDLDPNQDPNSKATQVRFKKKESKRQSKVPTRAPTSTPRTTIFDRRGTTSTKVTVSTRTTIGSEPSYSMQSGTFSFLNSPENWELIKQVEIQFNQDFPGSYVADKNTYDGIVTIIIPDSDLKWSTVFKYMEQHRGPLQIKHYAISQTSLEDIFLEFASDQVLE